MPIQDTVAAATPIQGEPALVIGGKQSVLCVADLHIGYEIELRESGFNVPDQTDAMLKAITEIDAGDRLVIMGDLKHSIPAARSSEHSRISRFLRSLADRFSSITLIAGNHDGLIESILPESIQFVGPEGIRVSSFGLVHGHSWPSKDILRSETLVWGHLHPCIRMCDRLGASTSMKCWVRGPVHPEVITKKYGAVGLKESIIMPSFNHMLVGTPVNEGKENRLSPFTRSGLVVLEEQRAYTLDGVGLGTISRLAQRRGKRKAK